MGHTTYQYEDDDKGFRIECDVEARVVPFIPATYNDPPEGGCLEDVTFTVNEFFLTVNGKEFDLTPSLTEEMKEALANEIDNAYFSLESMQQELYDKMNDG